MCRTVLYRLNLMSVNSPATGENTVMEVMMMGKMILEIQDEVPT